MLEEIPSERLPELAICYLIDKYPWKRWHQEIYIVKEDGSWHIESVLVIAGPDYDEQRRPFYLHHDLKFTNKAAPGRAEFETAEMALELYNHHVRQQNVKESADA